MMSNRDHINQVRPEIVTPTDRRRRSWRDLRPRRPRSVWGWLILVLFVLLLYLLITYVLIPWYRPVPTDVPPALNSNTRRA
jgi:polyferredoxin